MSAPLPYAKCLELKEAGWPQPTQEDFRDDLWFGETEAHGEYVMWPEQQWMGQNKAYSPSLEELIEGCKIRIDGKRSYIELIIEDDGTCSGTLTTEEEIISPNGLRATECRPICAFDGDNTKEAVANLWISLPPEVRRK